MLVFMSSLSCRELYVAAGVFISCMEAGGLLGQIAAGYVADKMVAMVSIFPLTEHSMLVE